MYRAARSITRSVLQRPTTVIQRFNSYESVYAQKLKDRAQQSGLSLEELRKQAHEKLKQEQREAALLLPVFAKCDASSTQSDSRQPKDDCPVKPLSDILRLPRVASATTEQVSALWTAYHASQSEGTGRGYICAAIPIDIYNKMACIGEKYPCFIMPLPRADIEDTDKVNYEFFFMEWGFHHSPPSPSPNDNPFVSSLALPTLSNPQVSTVLFTPLQEYKLRNSFATPYMILTHYTDLVQTHGIVLLRGEITPSNGGASPPGNFLLSQEDAQRLAMGIQKFYLWGEGGNGPEGEKLLTAFHTKPEEFSWEELLKLYNKTI